MTLDGMFSQPNLNVPINTKSYPLNGLDCSFGEMPIYVAFRPLRVNAAKETFGLVA